MRNTHKNKTTTTNYENCTNVVPNLVLKTKENTKKLFNKVSEKYQKKRMK